MLLDCSHGERTLPSSCCTATITARMISAPVSPLETSATRTAIAPTTKAPTIGMKPPKKVRMASGMASGTPTSTSPRPMSTASMALTIAWVRMKPPRVFHERPSTSAQVTTGAGAGQRADPGQEPRPSLRKKNVRISVMTSVMTAEVTAFTVVRTPEAIELALLLTRSWAAWMAVSSWLAVTKSLSWTQSWIFCRPSLALLAMSLD